MRNDRLSEDAPAFTDTKNGREEINPVVGRNPVRHAMRQQDEAANADFFWPPSDVVAAQYPARWRFPQTGCAQYGSGTDRPTRGSRLIKGSDAYRYAMTFTLFLRFSKGIT